MDIYAYAYDTFNILIDYINELHMGKVEKVKQDILEFLTSTSKYDNDFNKIISSEFNNIEMVKRVIMLIIASKAYMTDFYDYLHDINKEENEYSMKELENVTYKDIINSFYKADELADTILEDYFSYINRPYIFQNKCKSLILANGKRDILLKLNPFEVLDLYDYIDEDKYTNSEENIQRLIDIYEKSLMYALNAEYDEAQSYSTSEEFLVDIILRKLAESCKTKEELLTFTKYIISNVYETIVTELSANNLDYKRYLSIQKYIEQNDINDILAKVFTDYKFALQIIDVFLAGNDVLIEGDLLGKREIFKKVGNVKLLRKINPYYKEEEIVYKKIKETNESD